MGVPPSRKDGTNYGFAFGAVIVVILLIAVCWGVEHLAGWH